MIDNPLPLHPGKVLEEKIGTSAEMWVRMQADYDLWEARQKVA